MESPMTSSHMTLSDLERSNSRSGRFRSLTSCKGARSYATRNKSAENWLLSHQLQVSCRAPIKVHGPSCVFTTHTHRRILNNSNQIFMKPALFLEISTTKFIINYLFHVIPLIFYRQIFAYFSSYRW